MTQPLRLPLRLLFVALLPALLGACQSTYYSTMEKFGYAKRDILVDRVEAAAETQTEVKEQFQSAYQAFDALLQLESTTLQERYETLNDAYLESEEKAEELSGRIDDIESVAEALFEEWQAELDQYSSRSLRASSERKLKTTQRRYRDYLASLERSEAKMRPVLAVFKDQVLYLKHNLNAEKISALKGEVHHFDTDVQALVREMDRSIAEAREFISGLE
ncbi:DUF2959 domain-containing protein [Motiliproteus sp. SC1-56]|uniref:DUF2959 domain-containing protein n=1 Tax=Motiliproteus sp. SC1-56 TaxID=2799565 RepID=UPI001A8F6A9B|nr:DUF2959 domain-containing protein [Motiliproteus sp. SC1-56]